MSSSAIRPSLSLDRVAASWVLATVVLTVAPLLLRLDPLVSALAATPLLWHGLRLHRNTLAAPVHRAALVLLAGAAIAASFARYGSIFGKTPGIALLAMLVGLKLLESRTQRDAHVAIQLCFFLQLGYFLIEQSALTAALAFTACGIALAALQRIEQPTLTLGAALRGSLRLLIIALPLALALFLLFPRIDRPLWGMPSDAFTGTSGLSDSMSPGSITRLSLSSEIAFRADFEGPAPPMRDRYFRGPVLSDFDGKTWRQSASAGTNLAPDLFPAPNVRYTLTLEPHQQRWLLGLEQAIPGSEQLIDGDGVLRTRRPVTSRLRLKIAAHLPASAWRFATHESLRHNLALPAGANPRTVALGHSITRANPATRERIDAALDVLRNGRYVYTLTPPRLGQDMADEFLFDTQQGFCEHFAASFTILMRAAGVPARVVTGYQGGEVNPVDGSLVVRQSDAHAWSEVWLEGRGWIRIDPTAIAAPQRIDLGIASALPSASELPLLVRTDAIWLRAWRDRTEALSHAWNTWVLGYNLQRQQELMRRAGLEPSDWRTLVVMLVCAAVVWQITVWALPRRRRRPRSRSDQAWQRLLHRLRRHGFDQGESEGALTFAARVGSIRSEWYESLASLAEHYARLKYGPAEADQAARTTEFEHAIKEWISKH